MRGMINDVFSLSTDSKAAHVQQLALQDQKSNLKNASRKGSIYLQMTEKAEPRAGGIDTSTNSCPSEAEAMACMVGQNARRSIKVFAANRIKGGDSGKGASEHQPDKNVYSSFAK